MVLLDFLKLCKERFEHGVSLNSKSTEEHGGQAIWSGAVTVPNFLQDEFNEVVSVHIPFRQARMLDNYYICDYFHAFPDKLPEFEKTEAIKTALATRPEMQAQVSQERIAHLEKKSASEERAPQLDFSGAWLYQGSHFDNGIPAYTYQVGFSIPLFTGGRIHAEIARADLEVKHIDQNRQLLEERIVREVKSAVDELDAARKNVDVANLGLQLANEEVAQAERRFAAGVTTNVEVITAQDELARANNNQIDALYRFNQSRVNLARALGEVQDTYAK